ncbi:hypothetical protein ACJZTR_02725 [Neorickettsia risticii]
MLNSSGKDPHANGNGDTRNDNQNPAQGAEVVQEGNQEQNDDQQGVVGGNQSGTEEGCSQQAAGRARRRRRRIRAAGGGPHEGVEEETGSVGGEDTPQLDGAEPQGAIPEGEEGEELQYVCILIVAAFCLNYILRASLIDIRDYARSMQGVSSPEGNEKKESPLPQIDPSYMLMVGWFLYALLALVTATVGSLGHAGRRVRRFLQSGGADTGQHEENNQQERGELAGELDDPEAEGHGEGKGFG